MKNRLLHIVITGAPGAGKTTTVNTLRRDLGHLVVCAPEVATPLMTHLGIKPEEIGRDFVVQPAFQKEMYNIQKSLEDVSKEFALYSGKRAIIFDKARVEMAAHILYDRISLEEGKEIYKKIFGFSVEDAYKDYDLVLFLELPKKEVYNKVLSNNPARAGLSYEESLKVGDRVKEVWKNHLNFKIISSYDVWEEKLNKIRQTISDFLKNSPLS